MSGEAKSLKQQNAWLIRAVLAIHALAFGYVAFGDGANLALPLDDVALDHVGKALAPGASALAAMALAKLVLLGALPSRLRDSLVHWRLRHPLPGARAFTRIGPADLRVDMAALAARHGPLPSDASEQDRAFYKIYRTVANDVGVLDAHRSHLAARDICVINVLVMILLPGLAFWACGDLERVEIYSVGLFLAYVVTAFAAQTYARRFVENVLAAASGA